MSNASYVGSPTHVAGRVAGGVRIANSTQYVTSPDSPILDVGTGSFTIDAWIRTTSTNTQMIVDKRTDPVSTVIGYGLFTSSGRLGCQLADGFPTNFIAPANPINDGVWHFVVARIDRTAGTTGGKLFVDNVVVLTFDPTASSGSLDNPSNLVIGKDAVGAGSSFTGDIDEVELFGRAVPEAELQTIYLSGAGGKCKCLTLATPLRAWWPLDETTGATAVDVLGASNGSYIGGATHVTGEVAGGVHTAGGSQYVTAPSNSALNVGTGSFSLDAWVKTTTTGTQTIVDKRTGPPYLGYSLFMSSGYLGCQLADGVGIIQFSNYGSNTSPINDGAWHFVAMVVDRAAGTAGGKLYVDGVAIQTFNPTLRASSLTNSGAFLIGKAFNGGSWLDGDIDEVELVGGPLSPVEIQSLYATSYHGRCKSYTIVGTAGAHGTITPSGTVTKGYGSTQSYTITADPCYVANVVVDGVSVGAVSSYAFASISASHVIDATFTLNTYALTYTAGANGTITGTSPQTVNCGASGTAVTAVPNACYQFVNWSDGSTSNPRTDTNVQANKSVTASFAINTYT